MTAVRLSTPSLALFLAYPALRTQYDRPQLLLVLETTMALAGVLVALLAALRFSAVGLRTDLLLAAGFLVGSLSTIAFAIVPVLGGGSLDRADGWAALAGGIAAQGLVAIAPFLSGPSRTRDRALRNTILAAAIALVAAWLLFRAHGGALPFPLPLLAPRLPLPPSSPARRSASVFFSWHSQHRPAMLS